MRARVQNTTVLDVLDVAIELERKTMALYAGFVRTFQDKSEVRQFWFNMARSEAAHCGALFLVECILKDDPAVEATAKIRFDMATGTKLRSLLLAYRREQRRGVDLRRAFEMAVDLEGSELENVVVDLLRVVPDTSWRSQSAKMLLHDMGDLSYMIERYTDDSALLARADELLEDRAEDEG